MGMLFGAILPCLVGASTMTAVGRAAGAIVEEIRRQFREIPGLLEGKQGVEPQPTAIVDIATTAAHPRDDRCPALDRDRRAGARSASCSAPRCSRARSPARSPSARRCRCSWRTPAAPGTTPRSSSRRAASTGHTKGSDAHKAAVVGDTVGDPFKDTSGPGISILIKVMASCRC